eukprot:Gb_13345 [translate_table: standard]
MSSLGLEMKDPFINCEVRKCQFMPIDIVSMLCDKDWHHYLPTVDPPRTTLLPLIKRLRGCMVRAISSIWYWAHKDASISEWIESLQLWMDLGQTINSCQRNHYAKSIGEPVGDALWQRGD